MKTTIIAFYLPQFHPFPENDNWWGKGFTEWTNVGKAKPLFRGHKQPKVPADLGYYDLRLSETREQQAQLAIEAGVSGFCYWHYWFGNGKQLMNRIIDEVHISGKPDFPFCLGWANESWKAKQWNKNGEGDKILIEQIYNGEEDYRKHFDYVKELFQDKRYMRFNNYPIFYVYKPLTFPDMSLFIKKWNQWIKEEGIAEKIYFIANLDFQRDIDKVFKLGFDAVSPANLERMDYEYINQNKLTKSILKLKRILCRGPLKINYKNAIKYAWINGIDDRDDVIPFLIPNWDHTPRSGNKGRVLIGSTPNLFYEHAKRTLANVNKKRNKIVMLKSWNEWAEGNYMEPDLNWGKGYINALRKAIIDTSK